MNLSRVAITCAAPVLLGLSAMSAPALARTSPPPTPFERDVLAQLDPTIRADVQKRATEGNSVMEVIGTMLLNQYYKAGARHPGQALTVLAVDFTRGVVVFKRAPNVLESQRFDPKTLRFLR
jgi:hypothetical protein